MHLGAIVEGHLVHRSAKQKPWSEACDEQARGMTGGSDFQLEYRRRSPI